MELLEYHSLKNKDSFELRAFAKLNLYLEICGRRPDGYHELRSVMVLAEFGDMLGFSTAIGSEIEIEISGAEETIATKDNLVYKAAVGLKEKLGLGDIGTKIQLHKSIPMGAGLGGGSSDAATGLRGLSRLWGVSPGDCQLQDLASALGSDVPFFVLGRTALATGRGENVTRLPSQAFWVVIAQVKEIRISTVWAYAHAVGTGTKSSPQSLAKIMDALAQGDVGSLAVLLHNDFLIGIEKYHPAIKELRMNLQVAGALGTMLTGSGSAVYAVCKDETHANEVSKKIAHAGIWTWVCRAGINYEQ